FVETNEVDVALVMKEGAQYAAAQVVRTQLLGDRAWPELDEDLRKHVDRLAHRAHELVLFLGAGISQAAGLPSWDELLKALAGPTLSLNDHFAKLNPLDQARYLKGQLPTGGSLGSAVKEHVQSEHYALAHALLAALPA